MIYLIYKYDLTMCVVSSTIIYVSINFHQGRIKRSACNSYCWIKRRITEVFQEWINDRLILISIAIIYKYSDKYRLILIICSIAIIDK